MGIRALIRAVADALFPYIPSCVFCGVEKGVEDYLCKACAEKLEGLKAGVISTAGIGAYSLCSYDGVVKKLVTGYKYNGKKWLSRFMGSSMLKAMIKDTNIKTSDFSFVCNVPLHPKRRRKRGFDQSEELAKIISEISGIPYIPALRRIRNTKTQTKLTEKQREENIKGAFEKAADVSGRALLIDDVLTTGATARECAAVLREAGAKDVYVLTFAKSVYSR